MGSSPTADTPSLFAEALVLIPKLKGELPGQGTVLLTEPFLGVCKQVLPLIDVFGSALSIVKSDVGGNINRLEAAYAKDTAKHQGLYSIAQEEVEDGTASGTYSNTNALLWLTRAMDFLLALLKRMDEDQKCSVKEAALTAYSDTLSPYHGWIARQAFTVAVQFCPSRSSFFKKLGPGFVSSDLQKVLDGFLPVLADNHKFMESIGFDKETAA